jgi:hypothetical protein
MKKYEQITVQELKRLPKKITCNKCGKTEALVGTEIEREIQMNKFHTIRLAFGYGSNLEMEDIKFDLCESCLLEFVKSFKHAPETSE